MTDLPTEDSRISISSTKSSSSDGGLLPGSKVSFSRRLGYRILQTVCSTRITSYLGRCFHFDKVNYFQFDSLNDESPTVDDIALAIMESQNVTEERQIQFLSAKDLFYQSLLARKAASKIQAFLIYHIRRRRRSSTLSVSLNPTDVTVPASTFEIECSPTVELTKEEDNQLSPASSSNAVKHIYDIKSTCNQQADSIYLIPVARAAADSPSEEQPEGSEEDFAVAPMDKRRQEWNLSAQPKTIQRLSYVFTTPYPENSKLSSAK